MKSGMKNKIFNVLLALVVVVLSFVTATPAVNAETHDGSCGDGVYWSLDTDTGVLTISGSGKLEDQEYNKEFNEYAEQIKSVYIGSGISGMHTDVFKDLKNLVSIKVDSANSVLAADSDGVLYTKRAGSLCVFPRGKTTTSYTIPSHIRYIESYSFYGCKNLKSITIHDGVEEIENDSFNYCESLTHISLPSGLKTIEEDTFYDCTSLKEITIPSTVTKIGKSAFYGTAISEIYVSPAMTELDDNAFYNMDSLEKISVSASNSKYCSDENGVLYNKSKTVLLKFPAASSVTDYTVPQGVKEIKPYAFWESKKLKKITIADSVTSIGRSCFWCCGMLEEVKLPSKLTVLEENLFYGCNKLKNIQIPETVKTIKDDVFDGSRITELNIPASVTEIIGLSSPTSLKKITVDPENKNYCSDENGILYSKDKTVLYRYPCASEQRSFVVPDTVKTIDDYAFYYCDTLRCITLQDGVETIGRYSIYMLEECAVQIPVSVKEISEDAFSSYDTDIYYQGTKTEWEAVKIVDYEGKDSKDGLETDTVLFEIMPVEELLAEDEEEDSGIHVETMSGPQTNRPSVKRKDRPLNGEDVFVIVGIFGGVGVIFAMILRALVDKYKNID